MRFCPALSVWILASLVAFAAGCGYRTMLPPTGNASIASGAGQEKGSQEVSARRRPRLAVSALRNDSPEPWLDRILGDALRREMEARGTVRLVNDPADAELVLRGRIQPLITQSLSFSSFVAAIEYTVTMQVDFEVLRASGDVIRLDPTMLTEAEPYLASADVEVTRTHRLEALRHLSDVLASRVADSLELMERPIDVSEGIP